MLGRMLVLGAWLLAFWAEPSILADEKQESITSDRPNITTTESVKATPEQDTSTKAFSVKTAIENPDPAVHPAAQSTRVLFITSADCPKCEQELAKLNRSGGDFEALRKRGWKIGPGPENQIQIVNKIEIADLVRELNVKEFPTVACLSEGQIIRAFKSGCTTPLDAWTFGWLLKGQNERPQAPIPEPVRVAWTGNYRLRGNHWSVDGDWNPTVATLVSHLRSAVHAYGIASNWRIESWSYEELRSLHDDLHEREMRNIGNSPSQSSKPASLWPKNHSASSKIFGR